MPTMSFCQDFVWGTATASYQIEGAATAGGRGPSIWDAFSHAPGRVKGGHTGDVACDHYHRFAEDVDLMAGMGVGAYRFSTSWSRIMPNGTGPVVAAGLDFYERLVDGFLARKIVPYLTLYHWDLPLALHRRGGWLNPDMPRWFADYVQVLAERLGDRVQHWLTFNEPQCFLGLGLKRAQHAPGISLPMSDVLQAWHHALIAHGLAVQTLRAHCPAPPMIGCAPTNVVPAPASDAARDVAAARQEFFRGHDPDLWSLSWWTDPMLLGRYPADGLAGYGADLPRITDADLKTIAQPLDFLGINLYFGHQVQAGPDGRAVRIDHPPGHALGRNGWPVFPSALYWGPKFLWERYRLPVFITEHGFASHDWVHLDGQVHDHQRIDVLHRYLRELRRAAADGVDIRGYFHWSLLDNFEWSEGYQDRFGLIHVDFQDQRRTPKDSARWYAEVIQTNGCHL